MKIKSSSEKIKLSDNKKYELTHLTLNFSFTTTNKKYCVDCLTKDEKIQLVTRIFEISEPTFMEFMLRDKKRGLETIEGKKLSIEANYSSKFDEDEFRKSHIGKYAIIRLHPNNQGVPCRIVGQLIERVFYVMFFSRDHKLYK